MTQSLDGVLTLSSLEQGLPGLGPTWGKFLSEASRCCLEVHDHPNGVQLRVNGISDTALELRWKDEVTDQIRASWNDHQEMTEYGACGIAILLILKLTGFTVIRRARKGEGVDYWLGHKDSELPFQDAARLEVSGILSG